MGIIYLIENKINNQKYVGLTTRNLEIRWKEHTRHSSQCIDKAIQKYGKENFTITQIEECPDEELDEREVYWINYYNSIKEGYNLQVGGRNENIIQYPSIYIKVKEKWDEGYGQKAIHELLQINIETVHNYLLKSGVTEQDIRQRQKELVGKSKSKKIAQKDLDGNIIKIWDSIVSIIRAGITTKETLYKGLKDPNKIIQNSKWEYYKEKE